ncbi:hypothetical protein ACR6HW_14800 [Fusibacter sp. JL298sf-3]
MTIEHVTLQLGGIDIASIRECEIKGLIEADILKKGYDLEEAGDVNVYINVEGTAVTAYYTTAVCSGSVRMN